MNEVSRVRKHHSADEAKSLSIKSGMRQVTFYHQSTRQSQQDNFANKCSTNLIHSLILGSRRSSAHGGLHLRLLLSLLSRNIRRTWLLNLLGDWSLSVMLQATYAWSLLVGILHGQRLSHGGGREAGVDSRQQLSCSN